MLSKKYRTSDYLKTSEDIAAYLNEVLEDDDPKLLMLALRNVADSQGGITSIAEHTGLNRESLYKTLSGKRNPRIETINAILHVFGLRLSVTTN
ncbi:MAG: putative addiction module antidote protein [Proteobacteria bacterium]|nr:putative addiction module antidote protein [Pseudomonadota bacterium]MCH8262752.1 putative addiction module antidote protein [Pseudomonadota bacterium]